MNPLKTYFCSCQYSVSLYSQGGKPKRNLFRGASQVSTFSTVAYSKPSLSHQVRSSDSTPKHKHNNNFCNANQ